MKKTRRILVTGAASGIGAAICRRLVKPRDSFLVHTRSNRVGLGLTVKNIESAGGVAEEAFIDLAKKGSGKRLIETAATKLNGLDILITNAGYALRTPATDLKNVEFDLAHYIIARSFFEMTTAAIPFLKQSILPRIIGISSFGPHVWRPAISSFAATSAAKASCEAFAKALALQLAGDRITVNMIAPGFIEKDAGGHAAIKSETLQAMRSQIPMGRIGRPDEIAAAVEFCASEGASYMTGQVIHVNGGLV